MHNSLWTFVKLTIKRGIFHPNLAELNNKKESYSTTTSVVLPIWTFLEPLKSLSILYSSPLDVNGAKRGVRNVI